MEITEFLLARIADDEAVANLARPDDRLTARDRSFLRTERAGGYAHVAVTSGRVLAECEAKRAMLGFLQDLDGDPVHGMAVADALRRLALPFADHPDYREQWRP